MFEAVILAGGKGTRLKSVSGDTPKPMVNVAGSPFLYRLMRNLERQGCQRIILSLGYRADFIKEAVERDIPVKIPVDFSVEDTPLGTGGALKLASQKVFSERFVVLNGDSFTDLDLQEFLAKQNSGITICGVRVSDASRYGTLDVGTSDRVLSFREKGISGPGIINSGIYALCRDDLQSYDTEVFSFESDFIPLHSSNLYAHITDGYFIDIGIPEDFYKACEYFK